MPATVSVEALAFDISLGLARVLPGIAIAIAVFIVVRRVPWPRPFRSRFVLVHLAAAPATALIWLVLSAAITSVITGRPTVDIVLERPGEFVWLGVFLYAVITSVSYASDSTARAARAEAAAAQTRLAALRAQLQPHFLFNALHTVVQLIPVDPKGAVQAAELVADLLRATVDEGRDVISLAKEWGFVSRYLELEQIRFGERLRITTEIDFKLMGLQIPLFALQTLVENAVRHGAAPRVAPTEISILIAATPRKLKLAVRNTGDPMKISRTPVDRGAFSGTGLSRLREQLVALYGGAAILAEGPHPQGGFEAVLVLPLRNGEGA